MSSAGGDRNKSQIIIESEVKNMGRTGVEMEALTAVSIAALTIYDMCKAVDKKIIIGKIMFLEKAVAKAALILKGKIKTFEKPIFKNGWTNKIMLGK